MWQVTIENRIIWICDVVIGVFQSDGSNSELPSLFQAQQMKANVIAKQDAKPNECAVRWEIHINIMSVLILLVTYFWI